MGFLTVNLVSRPKPAMSPKRWKMQKKSHAVPRDPFMGATLTFRNPDPGSYRSGAGDHMTEKAGRGLEGGKSPNTLTLQGMGIRLSRRGCQSQSRGFHPSLLAGPFPHKFPCILHPFLLLTTKPAFHKGRWRWRSIQAFNIHPDFPVVTKPYRNPTGTVTYIEKRRPAIRTKWFSFVSGLQWDVFGWDSATS